MDPNVFWQHSYSGLYTILETNSKPYCYLICMTLIRIPLSKVLPRFKPIFWKVVFVSHSRLLLTTLSLLLWPQKSSIEQYCVFLVSFQYYTWEFALPNQVHQTRSFAHFAFHLTTNFHPSKPYLWLGGGQSEPYSWTCMPKKHKSTPSISSKAKRALVR